MFSIFQFPVFQKNESFITGNPKLNNIKEFGSRVKTKKGKKIKYNCFRTLNDMQKDAIMTKILEFSSQSDIFITLNESLKTASKGKEYRIKVLCAVQNRNAIMQTQKG